MITWFPSRLSFVVAAVLGAAAACTPRGDGGHDLGPIERLNAEEGRLARFTFPYYTSILARPGGGALAVWMRQEAPYRPMVYRRAPDAASDFGAQEYLGTGPFKNTISVVPRILSGGAEKRLYATWQAREPTSGDKSVVFRRSDDDGATWTEAQAVNSRPTAFIPSMAADPDGAIYIAWTDERDNARRIFFNRSLDGGTTWLAADVNLEKDDPGQGQAVGLDIASDGQGRVVVVWERQGAMGRSIQAATSEDRGATWNAITRVDDAVRGRYSATAPRVVFAADRAIVVWTAAATNSVARVWSDSRTAGGEWGDDVLVREEERGVPANVDLVARDGVAHVVISTGAYHGDWHVYHTRTGPNGDWTATGAGAVQLTTGEGQFANPRLAIDGDGRLVVAYVQDRKRVLLADSVDGGGTWRPARVVDELGEEDDEGVTLRYPQVSVADGVAYVIWERWSDRSKVFKTMGDLDTKVLPADLFVRRVRLAR